jgi:hypothetical protein
MIFLPSRGPEDWRRLLAEPEKQWRNGFSARTLAYCWESAKGLPKEIRRLLPQGSEALLVVPEWKTRLPGGRRESQSDVFSLVRTPGGLLALAVEGKVDEPFGPFVSEWLTGASAGKIERIRFIATLLGLEIESILGIRYQLLHRTVAALIEADRFEAVEAAMLVHSFSPHRQWFADFAAFANQYGIDPKPDEPYAARLPGRKKLTVGWASGSAEYLSQ